MFPRIYRLPRAAREELSEGSPTGRGMIMPWRLTVFFVLSRVVSGVNPDSGIVIDWKNLDKIVETFEAAPREAWLPAVRENCTMNGVSTLNSGGLVHEIYRPLFCPWFVKPFRDAFDLTVTETAK